jgi:hypothetical protein
MYRKLQAPRVIALLIADWPFHSFFDLAIDNWKSAIS